MSEPEGRVSRHIAVVGGGMLGLTLAHRLAGQGHQVELFEAAPDLGGLAGAWQLGDVTWDRHYHVTLRSDRRVLALLEELGLADELRFTTTRSACFADGRLESVSSALELLRFKGLAPVDRVRVALTLTALAGRRDWHRLEQIPVDAWLIRWSGLRAYRRFWLPLLRSKLGERHRDASTAFLWATVQRLTKARRTGLGDERFGHVAGGYARVLDRLAAVLETEGVKLHLACPVRRVGADAGTVEVTTPTGSYHFDDVVLTVTTTAASRMCPDLGRAEHQRLNGVHYQGVVCASVLLRKPLDGYYLTSSTEDDLPFTAVVEMTAIVDPAEVGGHTLVYLPHYAPREDPLFTASDETVRTAFLAGLRRIYPGITEDDVLAFRVSRVPQVFGVPTLGYSSTVPGESTSLPGVHLVTGAQIVNGTLNVEETITLAEGAAARIGGARPATVGTA